jgi:hypothetical protein
VSKALRAAAHAGGLIFGLLVALVGMVVLAAWKAAGSVLAAGAKFFDKPG